MRRLSAILLIAVIGLTAGIPLVFADPGSSRPICCRRDGKHHCALMAAQTQRESSEPAFRSVCATCSYFPSSIPVPNYSGAAAPGASPAVFDVLVSHPGTHTQCEARYRISLTRSHQKRGPPRLFS